MGVQRALMVLQHWELRCYTRRSTRGGVAQGRHTPPELAECSPLCLPGPCLQKEAQAAHSPGCHLRVVLVL